MAGRLALVIGRHLPMLTIVTVAFALAGAKVGFIFQTDGFFDG